MFYSTRFNSKTGAPAVSENSSRDYQCLHIAPQAKIWVILSVFQPQETNLKHHLICIFLMKKTRAKKKTLSPDPKKSPNAKKRQGDQEIHFYYPQNPPYRKNPPQWGRSSPSWGYPRSTPRRACKGGYRNRNLFLGIFWFLVQSLGFLMPRKWSF